MHSRIYVEKNPGFDIEAKKLTKEIRRQLSLEKITRMRVINRYDVVTDADIEPLIYGVFAEINQDQVYRDKLSYGAQDRIFGVEYQKGQYDARCDAAEQCVRLQCREADVKVGHAKIYIITGAVTDFEFQKIQEYLINPVDHRPAALGAFSGFAGEAENDSGAVIIDGFSSFDEARLQAFLAENDLAMDIADITMVRDYFRDEEKREPTETEIRVLDIYWSDHCRHTTFLMQLDDITFGKSEIDAAVAASFEAYLNAKQMIGRAAAPVTLMDLATFGARYNTTLGLNDDVEVSDEVNACSYEVPVDTNSGTKPYLIMFKNETHNHPTEIEPFGGAATCVGGAIRDPLSGRGYAYQSMRVTGSADPRASVDSTMKGKLPQRTITTQAAAGFSMYGNQIGLCTGQVKEYYHPHFAAKRMEAGAIIAAAPKENVLRLNPQCGDVVYVIGGRTGRDGIGGAAGSSKEQTSKSVETAGSEVQKGNAPEERKIVRLFRNPDCAKLIKKCNDFGAGGVSVAIGELADSLEIDLSSILLKYSSLSPTEIAISESQERMAVVIAAENEQTFVNLVEAENLEYSKSAVVTDSGRIVMKYKGETVLDISRAFISTNGAPKTMQVHVDFGQTPDAEPGTQKEKSFKAQVFELCADLNICSQKGLAEYFDATIGSGTVTMPFGGKYYQTPSDVMVAKVPVLNGTASTVTHMAHGYDPYLCETNPYLGGMYAVAGAVSKLACSGVAYRQIKLSCQEYFGKLRGDARRWAKPFGALLGALDAQLSLGVSSIGGKDSMSGSYEELDVPPTLICFGVGASHIDHVVTNDLKDATSYIAIMKNKRSELGVLDFKSFSFNLAILEELISDGKVHAAKSVGYHGVLESVMKMCAGSKVGFDFSPFVSEKELTEFAAGDILVQLSDDSLLEKYSALRSLGRTNGGDHISYSSEIVPIDEMIAKLEAPLSDVFPIRAEESIEAKEVCCERQKTYKSTVKYAKPRVFIPVFPGTNGEYDMAAAFEDAGAVCESIVFRNIRPGDIQQSIEAFARAIDSAQIIALPGGSSAADEPDGSAKFIAAVLKNPFIAEALERLLQTRDGLILGIDNGFQALIKTGLLPYGRYGQIEKLSPTLACNTIGRHVAKHVRTKIVSNKSPWLSEVKIGDVHTVAVSSTEGRFMANDNALAALIEGAQIATQYCDEEGRVIGDGNINPNGSVMNVEGILSPDGRIFGKMGHSERTGAGLYKNVPNEFDQKIFLSGVRYYS